MMPKAKAEDVLYISKSKKARIDTLIRGAQLVDETGYSIGQLQAKAVQDRLLLARRFIAAAEHAVNQDPPSYRTAVSRAYYAMYHVFRSVSYYSRGGDDHQEHNTLPGKIPPTFPNHPLWENDLKAARLERNRADYDPYPKNDGRFEITALHIIDQAKRLLPVARQFLKDNGFQI